MKIAVFPGSFDPITSGHVDIVARALPLFDKLIIGIGVNSQKSTLFDLEQLPEGYQTMLLPAGRNLPQKVRVRLMLARTLLSDPLLLMAEAFFAGQEQNDRKMIADLFTAPERNWTLVATSDDPYLASKCDRIIILENGKIAASGSFETVRRSPHFKKVFKTVG